MSETEISIRNASVNDIAALAHLKVSVISNASYLLETPSEINPDLTAISRQIEFLSKSGGHYLVAIRDSELVGCLTFGRHSFQKIRHRGGLQIMVSPDHQGRGIATALLTRFLELSNAQPDLERIDASVMSSNHAAIHLYEKFGFRLEGTRPRAFRFSESTYEDELYFGLLLR